MIFVSNPNPVLIEIILSVSEKLSESVLCCTTHIFVLCLFCLIRQNNGWSYFTFCWTRLVELVTWHVQNASPA